MYCLCCRSSLFHSVFIHIVFGFFSPYRWLNCQCEQTRSHGKSQSSPFLPNLFQASSWVASCPSAAFSSSSSSFSTASGIIQSHELFKIYTPHWCCKIKNWVFSDILYLQVSSDVLYVWLPVLGVYYPPHHMLGSHHSALLLSFVCWGEDVGFLCHKLFKIHAHAGMYEFICIICDNVIDRK